MKEIKFKCWLEEDRQKFYGPGPNELIKKIHQEGSLSKAAAKMNLSYKKAWEMVQRLNHHSDKPFVLLKKGGSHGGGAEVTSFAMEFSEKFEEMEKEMSEIVKKQKNLTDFLN